MRLPTCMLLAAGILAGTATTGCNSRPAGSEGNVQAAAFGEVEGQGVQLYTLRNARGLEARITNFGAIIVSLRTPDREGNFADIVLGFDSLAQYVAGTPYFGAIVGRYGNRIARGRFAIDGVTYSLTVNDGAHHLHGGVRGFDKVVWQGEPFERATERGVILRYTSRSGEEGYPGTLQATVTYTLTDDDELAVDYLATTDQPTPVNLTQHSYFNLTGTGSRDILGHRLMIPARRYTPVDSTLIPTGELAPVEGTPFDFKSPTAIGARIGDDHPQLRNGRGYDHNFVLDRQGNGLELAARVVEPESGRTLEITTTEPGIQFYSGNFLDGSITGKDGSVYAHRTGFCLETQHFPDSPNQPAFPSTILRPGQEYRSRTVFKFGVTQ